jgi:Txe/YoeB family toxin of toxin-antitoxin system
MYRAAFTKLAQKDAKKAKQNGYRDRINELTETVENDPFEPTPGHCLEKLKGFEPPIYTRRINRHHRFVYTIEPNTENEIDKNGTPYEGIVVVHRLWGHFPEKPAHGHG